ncbi:MAG: PD-(D/E)XK nuclease family protein, partial [Prochlorotrichaceae cyanobacterium]
MNTLSPVDTQNLIRKGLRNGQPSIPLKKLAEVLAGANTCYQQLLLSVRYQPVQRGFDLNGWQAEHQPGVAALADYLQAHYPCRRVQQEVWLPEVLLPGGFLLTGKADVVAILEDGGVIVADFKTGGWRSESHWFQCVLAAKVLVKAGHGNYVAAVVRQYRGQEPEVEGDVSKFLGASQLALMKRVLNLLAVETVQTTPTLTNCRFCDFRSVCGDAVLEPEVVAVAIDDLL